MALPVSQGGIDYPDGGFPSGAGAFPLVGDLAELAARLGSPDTYDRRGNVIFADDFRHGDVSWENIEGEGDGEVAVVAADSYQGPFCLRITSGDEAGVDQSTVVYKNISAGNVSKYGLECSVRFYVAWDNFRLRMDRRDGTTSYAAEIRLSYADDEIQYLDSDSNYTKIAALAGVAKAVGQYHTVKLVVDFEENTYYRLLIDEVEYDLSAYDVESSGDANEPSFYIAITLVGRDGTNDKCHVDDVIFTRNEPD